MTATNPRKSRRNPGRRRRQPHGGELKTGGTNPGAGRPSNEFRERCREAMGLIDAIDIASSIAGDTRKAARDRLAALAWLADRAYGKPSQAVEGQDAQSTEGKFILEFVDARCPKCGYSDQDEVQGEQVTALGVHE